jgi:hypothetical protein
LGVAALAALEVVEDAVLELPAVEVVVAVAVAVAVVLISSVGWIVIESVG